MLRGIRATAIVFGTVIAAACSQAPVSRMPETAAAPAMADVKPPVPAAAGATDSSAAGQAAVVAQVDGPPRAAPGSDRDAKGCIGSAGYAWSHLLAKCIRVFEAGIRLNPKAKSLDKTQSAFAVFVPGDDSRAEIFLPARAPVILARDADKDVWRDGAYVLSRAKNSYALSEVSGTRLYEGTSR